ncbi:MAG: PilN domain-containing protein [Anaerolineae bacterium]|nr:PilN domain-containing protein [Anaerolineae bacterium]
MTAGAPPPDELDILGEEESPPPIPRLLLGLWLLVIGMVFFFIPLFLVFGGIRAEVRRLQADLKPVQETVEALKTPGPQELELQKRLEEAKASVKALKDAYGQIVAKHADWPAIMEAISTYNPSRLMLTSLKQADLLITLSGRAIDDAAVVAYAHSLEASGLFSRVVVRSIHAVEKPFVTPVPPSTPITPSLTLTVTLTPTPDLRDEYELDDFDPKDIFLGQSQHHNFYPLYDVDTVRFLAKAGRLYRVATSNLAPGVDTFLSVNVGGAAYTNDDRKPGDLSSEIVFQVGGSTDVEAVVTVTNRGQFGPEQWYDLIVEEVLPTATPLPTGTVPPSATPTSTWTPTPTSTATATPSPTVTPRLEDDYEPDDAQPSPIALGEVQEHTFYPANDVDKVKFLAKAGRYYRVSTFDLTTGVDTFLFVMVGATSYTNDDRAPGDPSSEVTFGVGMGYDVEAVIEIVNRGQFGPGKSYRLTVEEIVPTPSPTPTQPSPTPDLRDAFEPDDAEPRLVAVGSSEVHNFYPDGDVDRVRFLAKAGRKYRVFTSDLALGVDTFLLVSVGTSQYANDDRFPGDPSSELTFEVPTSYDVIANVEVSNRGQFGEEKTYRLTIEEVVQTPVPTPTPSELGDIYEPDDVNPKFIAVGETQSHTFYPEGDIDKLRFLAKAGRTYRVFTSDLSEGVDTYLTVDVGGSSYGNDDRRASDPASEVVFTVGASDEEAILTLSNRGSFGPDQGYKVTVEELALTPVPTATPIDFGDEYEPDDEVPKPIAVGETQTHTFYPEGDVDKLTFLAKEGRFYRIATSSLALGVDTVLTVDLEGTTFTNDDRADREPGDLSSELTIEVPSGHDIQAVITIENKGLFGPDKSYAVSVEEVESAFLFNGKGIRGAGLASWRGLPLPLYFRGGRGWTPLIVRRNVNRTLRAGSVEFVIGLEIKARQP